MANITRARTGEFLRKLFEVLMAEPEGMHASAAIELVRSATKLSDYEAGSYPSGGQRFEKILRFATVDCVKAGWLRKDDGVWTVTDAGAKAYTVCGKLKSDFRYSNTLGWNTFPVPRFSDEQLDALSASARRILRTRYEHHPATIAQLYDPDKMPDDLRQAHKDNDDLLESMYIGRPFRNDTERLETLFKLYAAKTAQ